MDEQLDGLGLEVAIARWYPGKIAVIKKFRPDTLVKDDVIPVLLRQVKRATFVTINWADFWQKSPADKRYCIICFPFPRHRIKEIPDLLRQVLKLKQFNTKAGRMGTVMRVTKKAVHYYRINDPKIYTLNL
ncbi:MAG: hypothetical protein ACRENG_01420 [bacterium]